MNQFFKRQQIKFFLAFLIFAGLSSCNKDISISLDNSGEEDLSLSSMDSASILVSTYQLDDIPTSASGALLIGKTKNSKTGAVIATSYMRLGIPTEATAIPTNAIFDSLTFLIKPNRYFYGDTTKRQTFHIHRVTEEIKLKAINTGSDIDEQPVFVSGPAIFNDQTFTYDVASLGSLTFNPRVRSIDSLHIRLDQSLGNTLFDYLRTSDSRVSSNTNFQEFFKGLAIVPDENNTALLGFRDTVFMQVHYSYPGADGFRAKAVKSFSIDDKNYQFNNIKHDRKGTHFESLTIHDPELLSRLTEGDAYAEGGTGVVTRLRFPSLLDIVSDPKIAINKAELVIEVANGFDFQNPPPSTAVLFIANKNVNPTGLITIPQSTATQAAAFIRPTDQGANGKYIFNMIDYLNNIKKTSYFDTSLLLSVPTSQLFASGNRIVIAKDGGKPKIKLNIVYTKF